MIMVAGLAVATPPDPVPQATPLIRQKKFTEAATLYEKYLATNRFDGPAWSQYSNCLHGAKQYPAAIDAAKKAIGCGVNPAGQMYNIACGYALLGKKDEAIDWLKKALDSGFPEQATLENDEDTESLRSDPRFIHLTGLKPPADLSPAKQWEWDLDFLVRRMEQMHWRLYANVSKQSFLSEIQKLKSEAPSLSLDRAWMKLSRILAMVGDGHTLLAAFPEGKDTITRVPLHLYSFRDGIFVIGAPEARRDLVGCKLVRVGKLDVNDAVKRLQPYCSVDNEMGYLERVAVRLIQPAALQEIGASESEMPEYTLQFPDGSARAVQLAAEPVKRATLNSAKLFRPDFVYANAKCKDPPPLCLQDVPTPLTLKHLEDCKAMYFGFHAVANNKDQPFADFVATMSKQIEEKKAEYLFIDMRFNGGGNTGLIRPLLEYLVRNERINRPGHLFVIIGRGTFSAAQNTVNQIEANTNATFVGEPTGSRPNFVGESTYLVLPYSKFRVYCSSRYWQHVSSTDQRYWVHPQIAAEQSFTDFAANRDPCLDAILTRIKSE